MPQDKINEPHESKKCNRPTELLSSSIIIISHHLPLLSGTARERDRARSKREEREGEAFGGTDCRFVVTPRGDFPFIPSGLPAILHPAKWYRTETEEGQLWIDHPHLLHIVKKQRRPIDLYLCGVGIDVFMSLKLIHVNGGQARGRSLTPPVTASTLNPSQF